MALATASHPFLSTLLSRSLTLQLAHLATPIPQRTWTRTWTRTSYPFPRIPFLHFRLASILIPTISHLSLPSILSGLWESVLRAVPKKKTSHSKKRSRFMAGKALQDVTALNKCSACGTVKRAHLLCPFCVNGTCLFPLWSQLEWVIKACSRNQGDVEGKTCKGGGKSGGKVKVSLLGADLLCWNMVHVHSAFGRLGGVLKGSQWEIMWHTVDVGICCYIAEIWTKPCNNFKPASYKRYWKDAGVIL